LGGLVCNKKKEGVMVEGPRTKRGPFVGPWCNKKKEG